MKQAWITSDRWIVCWKTLISLLGKDYIFVFLLQVNVYIHWEMISSKCLLTIWRYELHFFPSIKIGISLFASMYWFIDLHMIFLTFFPSFHVFFTVFFINIYTWLPHILQEYKHKRNRLCSWHYFNSVYFENQHSKINSLNRTRVVAATIKRNIAKMFEQHVNIYAIEICKM